MDTLLVVAIAAAIAVILVGVYGLLPGTRDYLGPLSWISLIVGLIVLVLGLALDESWWVWGLLLVFAGAAILAIGYLILWAGVVFAPLVLVVLGLIFALSLFGYLTRDEEKGPISVGGPPGAVSTTNTAISGRVVDTSSNPIAGATVRVIGPFNATESGQRRETTTNSEGEYRIDNLPLPGKYDVYVEAGGFEPSYLVSSQNIEEVVGDYKAPQISLKRKTEVQVSLRRSSSGFVFGQGVDKEDVPRVLMAHGIILSPAEIESITDVRRTGSGWTTFIRDGQTVSTVAANYNNEPFWRVTFKDKNRPDELDEVFVQRICGNVTVPPGVKIPQLTPVPTATPTATPERRVPTATPTTVSTSTPPPTSTRVPPTATPPPPTQTAQPRPTQPAPCCPTAVNTPPAQGETPIAPSFTPVPTQSLGSTPTYGPSTPVASSTPAQ